jgi:YfiH family protein
MGMNPPRGIIWSRRLAPLRADVRARFGVYFDPPMSDLHPDWLRPTFTVPGVVALMTTRHGGFSEAPFDSMNVRDGLGDEPVAVGRNRALLERAIGVTPVHLDQVHGRGVVLLHRADAQRTASPRQADASFTTDSGVACAVQVADCLPVLFAAPGAVAAAHAGWRGLVAGVLEATLDALCAASGCQPEAVEAWLGPCIGPRKFEVGDDVRQAFGGDQGADALRFAPLGAGKWLANLPLLASDRLRQHGVKSISGGSWCTVEDASRFFSFRRDRVTGRMVAAIWLVG